MAPKLIPSFDIAPKAAEKVDSISKFWKDKTIVLNINVKKYKMEKVVTELTILALILLFPTLTVFTALGWIRLTKPRLISFRTIKSLITLNEPVVEAEHPPIIIRDISRKQQGAGHKV